MSRQQHSLEYVAERIRVARSLPPDALLSPAQAAEALAGLGRPMAVPTLAKLRCLEPGRLPFQRRGRFITYKLADLQAFAARETA